MTGATEADGRRAPTRAVLAARSRRRYWRSNLRLVAVLLGVWALASFGAGVLLADRLNELKLPFTGFPLGFWFAHQGAIVVFVLCILCYCIGMNRLDRRHHEELEAIMSAGADDASPSAGGEAAAGAARRVPGDAPYRGKAAGEADA